MEIKRFEGTGRMSRVVEHKDTLYLCGQTAKLDGPTIALQTRGVLKKVEDLLILFKVSLKVNRKVYIYIILYIISI